VDISRLCDAEKQRGSFLFSENKVYCYRGNPMNTQTIIIREHDVEVGPVNIPANTRLAIDTEIEDKYPVDVDVFAELHPKSNPALFADEIIRRIFQHDSDSRVQVFIKVSEQIYKDFALGETVSRLYSAVKGVKFNICAMPRSFSKETSAAHKLVRLLDDHFGKKFVMPYPMINVMDDEQNVAGKLDMIQEMTKIRHTGIGMIAFGNEGPVLDIQQILETNPIAYFSVKAYLDINRIEEPQIALLSLVNGEPVILPPILGTVLRKTPSRDKVGLHTTVITRLHPGDKLNILEVYPIENGVQYAKLTNGRFVVISEQGVQNIQIIE